MSFQERSNALWLTVIPAVPAARAAIRRGRTAIPIIPGLAPLAVCAVREDALRAAAAIPAMRAAPAMAAVLTMAAIIVIAAMAVIRAADAAIPATDAAPAIQTIHVAAVRVIIAILIIRVPVRLLRAMAAAVNRRIPAAAAVPAMPG